jgi:uncharacterized protein YlxW (UPF0749 family)
MDKTVKTHAFPGGEKIAAQSNLSEVQEKTLELAKMNAQFQEEKGKSIELHKTIEQLRASLAQEQAKSSEMAERAVMLEARIKELSEQGANPKKIAELEARVKELSEVLGKISGIAATGKAGQ